MVVVVVVAVVVVVVVVVVVFVVVVVVVVAVILGQTWPCTFRMSHKRNRRSPTATACITRMSVANTSAWRP